MIFDDLKNISFYKGIHPNLDKAIDYLYEHRKDTFELGKYDIDGDKVFLVVQENVLNKEENDRFEHHKNYADLHLLVEGHEYSSYGSRIKDEAVAFVQAVILPQHDASAEINPPAGLSSIHSPILGRV